MLLFVVSKQNYLYWHTLVWQAFKGALPLQITFLNYLFTLTCKSSVELDQTGKNCFIFVSTALSAVDIKLLQSVFKKVANFVKLLRSVDFRCMCENSSKFPESTCIEHV